ncbi:MAG TPA: molybdopterin-binding/glycosyltransferase family 2 protein [Acetobacteraceae bacterium]|nr:molybdopterin-binding/glycosyltransferase family 2 protein [Acetobacteraceae bacterium]
MIFGRIALDEAEGAVLAHTQRLPGRVLKKGSILDAAAVEALRAAGFDSVIAARLEPGDVPEDEAAGRLADALLAPGLVRSGAGTGRVNLGATKPGLLRVDAAAIDAINQVHEALTVGTLPDYAVVGPKEMVATIKVIPFAVPSGVVERAVAAAGPALQLHAFRPLKVGLVMTTLPGLKPSILAGTAEATASRVAGLTGTMLPPIECAHDEAPIADGLARLIEQGADILLVAGASAVVDRRDVGPAGIVRAGGEIIHFGMPVDPGNLICLGRIGERPALVLPGCARSPKLNGIDFVLSRLFAGLELGGAEIARMGVGGLLKDVAARPLPRAKATAPVPAQPRGKPVAAVVLAAGQSSRMAPHNKLLVPDRTGKPMVARVVDNLLSSGARPVLVVVGHRGDEVTQALGGRPVTFVTATDYASGLSASLRAGIAAVPAEASAAIVCLGDMPLVTGRMIDRLIETYDADEGRLIVAPTGKGKLGNPVLWDRRYFPEIMALAGDVGARKLLERHEDALATVELGDAVLRDFDTVESLATLPGHMRPALEPSPTS